MRVLGPLGYRRLRLDRNRNKITADEQALFEELRADRLGARVRLEQERISFSAVERAVAATEVITQGR